VSPKHLKPPWGPFRVLHGKVSLLLSLKQIESSPPRAISELILSTGLTADNFFQWNCCTDFNLLRSLSLRSGTGISAVAQLAQIPRQCSLAAPSSLQMNVEPRYTALQKDSDVDPAMTKLLQTLCPLEELTSADRFARDLSMQSRPIMQKNCVG
jgi:hypothetical protein